jgi:hypothetical protein
VNTKSFKTYIVVALMSALLVLLHQEEMYEIQQLQSDYKEA